MVKVSSVIPKIQEISAEQTYRLRHKLLRPLESLEACAFIEDTWTGAFHLGAFVDETLVGIASFFPQAYKDYPNAYRLRGMASDSTRHGQGIGRSLLEAAFIELNKRSVSTLWCNAREVAFGFYEKMGFRYDSEMFEIPGVGPHKVMLKADIDKRAQ